MALVKKNISFVKGDSYTFYFSLNKSDYISVDQLYYTVKAGYDGKVLLRKTLNDDIKILYKDSEKVHYFMLFKTNDTDELKADVDYLHEIEAIMGKSKETIMQGNLTLKSEVTKTRNEK